MSQHLKSPPMLCAKKTIATFPSKPATVQTLFLFVRNLNLLNNLLGNSAILSHVRIQILSTTHTVQSLLHPTCILRNPDFLPLNSLILIHKITFHNHPLSHNRHLRPKKAKIDLMSHIGRCIYIIAMMYQKKMLTSLISKRNWRNSR